MENEDSAVKLLQENVKLKGILKEIREYVKVCKEYDTGIRYQRIEEMLDKEYEDGKRTIKNN